MPTPGERGPAGPRGAQGIQGVSSSAFKRSLGAVLMFVIAAFVLLGVDAQRDSQQTCESRQANVARTNDLYRGLIALDEEFKTSGLPPATVATLDNRIDLFTDALLVPPTCKEWWEL